jgi:hypothetical protein
LAPQGRVTCAQGHHIGDQAKAIAIAIQPPLCGINRRGGIGRAITIVVEAIATLFCEWIDQGIDIVAVVCVGRVIAQASAARRDHVRVLLPKPIPVVVDIPIQPESRIVIGSPAAVVIDPIAVVRRIGIHCGGTIIAIARLENRSRGRFAGGHLKVGIPESVPISIHIPGLDNPLAIVDQAIAVIVDFVAHLGRCGMYRCRSIVTVLVVFYPPLGRFTHVYRVLCVSIAIIIGVGVPDSPLDIRVLVITVPGPLDAVLIDIPSLRVLVGRHVEASSIHDRQCE